MPPSANPCLMAKSIHQGFAGHNAQRVGLQVLPSLVRIGKSTWRGGIGLNAEIWERSNFRWFSAPASMCSTRATLGQSVPAAGLPSEQACFWLPRLSERPERNTP